ncbi:MAG: hypothetical protein LLF94_06960 [Chlamydiales bacterium]|nr:hypothetical protein [Chlamydiales bacterium]
MNNNISNSPLSSSANFPIAESSPTQKSSSLTKLVATERRTLFRNSTNSISLSSAMKFTSASSSPVAARKALTTGTVAVKVLTFLRSIGEKLTAPKHSQFNKLIDQAKVDPEWKINIKSEVKKLSLESFTSLVRDLDASRLRGFDRVVLSEVVETLSEIAANLPNLPAELSSNIKSLQAHFTPAAMSLADRANFITSIQFAPTELTVDNPKPVGKGAVNTVIAVPFTHEGVSGVGVFKADPSTITKGKLVKEKLFGTAEASGIPVGKNAHFTSRAVASSVVDELLFPGDPSSVRTQFATVNGQRGILMETAEGKSPVLTGYNTVVIPEDAYLHLLDDPKKPTDRELNLVSSQLKFRDVKPETDPITGAVRLVGKQAVFANFKPDNAKTMEGLLKLQIKDWITGQVDRHPGNYFISDSGKVTGIDEDCSFGVNAVPENGDDVRSQKTLMGIIPNNSSLMLRMPPAMTETIKNQVLNLCANKEKLAESLKPYLTDQEIKATITRLNTLEQHIKSLCIIVAEPSDLFSDEVQQFTDSNNSYWARERMVFDPDISGWNYLRAARDM